MYTKNIFCIHSILIHQIKYSIYDLNPINHMLIFFFFLNYQNENSKFAIEQIHNFKNAFQDISHIFRNALVNKFHDQNGE